jgi:large subunit ribosomal protein L13
MEYTIDAQNKKLGRVASEVATILMGKNKTSFVRNLVADVKVKVMNAGKISVTNKTFK